MNEKKILLLIDGSSYLYRAYHAMPDLRADPNDPNSAPTGAIRGMINMLEKLRREVNPDYVACVFDAKGPTFRDELYADYKAHRPPMPESLAAQIEPIHEVVRLLGWPVLEVPGVEADDVIGTLAVTGARQGLAVIVSSGDKDLAQLVNDDITIIDTMSGKTRDRAGVEAEFGVPPERMLDFQVLVGDAIDNVPGVEKVGPKTAAKWLQAYGSLDGVIAHADEIKGVVGENLRRALSWLPQGRELLRIRTDCDLSPWIPGFPALEALRPREPDRAGLRQFYERYGFRSLARALDAGQAPPPAATARNGDWFADADPPASLQVQHRAGREDEIILDWDSLDRWLERLRSAPLAALDTETTSLDEMQARIVGISFCVEPEAAAYIPLAHEGPDAPQQLPLAQVLDRLRPWLEDPRAPKLGQHVKYDRHVFANHGIEVRGYAHDTMLQSYVLEVHRPHNLGSLAERHLGLKSISYEEVAGKGARQIPFAQVAVDRAAAYSCEDSALCLMVHRVLAPRLEAEPKLADIYALEMATSEVLFRMERNGVLIDAQVLARLSHELGERLHAIEQEAYALAGQPFNLGSPKQLGEIFFDKLGLPSVKKTATGARSTDEEVLEKLAEDYPLPAKVLEWRSLSKLKGTYTDKLAQMADPRTGRVHTHYAQAVAVTGRLSSNEPNLQNIPVRTPEGRRIREAFIAPPGRRIASADYSQIELRIMAHLSGDEALLAAFRQGLDVHRATAAEVFGVAPDQVTPEQRRYAKVINFGLIYGMSSYGLAKNLGIDNSAAKAWIDRYFQRYPGVKRYMDETRAQAKAQGYVETVFGRRLYLPEINSPNGPRRGAAERAAINAPMQGTAADLIKKAMVAVQQALDARARGTLMIMQVHDELVFELPEDEVDWLRSEIPRLMAGVAELRVPLVAEIGVGANWEEAH
ncbi:DNA polymerase I [Tibeticola sp.]|uniref:DNA polymerase I n=1 Tax=Tibeticola sp. TaxID=2005368 RepID=UPI002590895A|nr:DNA polymerase I [Tibeticola sp.]MCI4440557.1 DNA polymerase I [Tibeticola sp.]